MIAARYNSELKPLADAGLLTLPYQLPDTNSAWHLYVIHVGTSARRRQVFDALHTAGIKVQVHYIPVYHHPFYRANGYADTYLPNTEWLYAGIISLPMYPELTDDEQGFVIETLKKELKKERCS
jgi:dTDP-4-amino-4,6-dideoxygalactose transaminase